MYKITKRIGRVLLCVVSFVFVQNVCAQQIGLGGSLLFNPQTESLGAGLRVEVPYKKITFIPQLTYYPSFNKISEFYLGVSSHLDFMGTAKWKLYLIGMLGYNRWINYESNPQLNAKPNNWDAELGIGFTTKKCIRPFIEYRYNLKWHETNLGVGIIFTLHCSGGRKRGSIACPGH